MKKSVAFLGETGSFSQLAAHEYFGTNITYTAVADFTEIFSAVTQGKCTYGIVPIENSMAGSIHQSYDLLLEYECCIIGEIYLHIEHFLIANKGVSKKSLKQVYSHPQPLAQCRLFLKTLGNIETVPFPSTTAAIKNIKEENKQDVAAIGSYRAAIDNQMTILAKNIEDNSYNLTRFLLIAQKPPVKKQAVVSLKTSIVFCTSNTPGVLFKALAAFALRDINLLKIESRPLPGKHFEYIFYLDFQGDSSLLHVEKALLHLQESTTFFRNLGTYPSGNIVRSSCKKQ